MNTIKKQGRKRLVLRFPDGPFTVKGLFKLNCRKVDCELTIRNHINRGQTEGSIVRLTEKETTGKVGAPRLQFKRVTV